MLTIDPGSRTHLSKSTLKRHLDELERVEEALRQYRHLAKAREFVNGQPCATVTLTTTAHAIGISQSHLARLFQEKVGMSFHHWLTLRRIYKALMLMRERPITAFQAAHLSGFASYRSFARAFKEVVDMSPSAYLKAGAAASGSNLQIIDLNLQISVHPSSFPLTTLNQNPTRRNGN